MLSKPVTLLMIIAMTVGAAKADDSKETCTIDKVFEVDEGRLFTVDIDVDIAELTVTRSGDRSDCRVCVEYEPDRFIPEISFTKNNLDLEIECEKLFCNDDDD